MQPQPSNSAGTSATACSSSGGGPSTANDGVQDAVVVASSSGSPPHPVQQQQQEDQLTFYYPATFKQIRQLFAMTCRIKLQRCDAGGPADSRSVRKVEEESDTDSNSSDDDEVKVFPAPRPQQAASSTKNGPIGGTKKKRGKIQRKSSTRCCRICKKTFNSLSNLKGHMQRSHSREKRYSCDNCGASFWNRTTFLCHKKRMTEQNGGCPQTRSGGWRPKGAWTCRICGKRFKQPSYYGIHMRLHRGEKPFKCGDCGKAFAGSSQLCLHRKIHTDVWPYSCVFCEKEYRQKSHYWSHLRVHTEETPYFCKVNGCGASFRHPGSLKKHQRLVRTHEKY